MSPSHRSVRILACLLMFSWILPAFSQTAPEKFLGFRVGDDRKLADVSQIVQYLKKLDQESPKLKLVEIGLSVQKRPLVMAVITSEANMAKLDQHLAMIRKLRDPRQTSEEEARRIAREGKIIVLITCNIHSTEIASSQMALELAYKLVTGDTPFPADSVLENVIFLLVPTSNPDGTQMVCDWYRKYLGTPYEGGRMPWLYHYYAGHDDNRDWFMLNLPETRAVTRVLYQDWLPQIHLDEHQMGSTGARMFIPPFMDPPVPHIQPLLWRSVALCGANMAYDLEAKGLKGVVHRRSFTGWWIGACDDTSWLHNVVGLLSEGASPRIASPIFVDPTELERSYVQKMIDYPNPWPGGTWKLRDLVDYELVLSFSLLKTAARNREEFLFNFYRMYQTSLEKREPGEAFAYVVPSQQADPLTTIKMIDILMTGGVEVHQALEEFRIENRIYPAGSYLIFTAQPYKPYATALFERQRYPDLRQREGEPPIPPYDNAGWTLPLQMGIDYERIGEPFSVKAQKLTEPPKPEKSILPADAPYLLLDPRINLSYKVVFSLLASKVEVWRSRIEIGAAGSAGHPLPAGAFLVPVNPASTAALQAALAKWPIPVLPIKEKANLDLVPLKAMRIALYQPWTATMDEGWTRYVLDDFAIPYTLIHNSDFKEKAKEKLASRFDIIILPSENADLMKTGKPDPTSRWGAYYTPLPPEYEGGIEKEGIDQLKSFVGGGGILLALNQASELVLKEFSPPVQDVLAKVDESKFFCPTSLLAIDVDTTSPLAYGMKAKSAAMFAEGLAFSTRVPSGEWDRRVVASYPEDNILLSGWLTGESMIARKAAVVDLSYKKGRIFLFGIPVQNRAQTHGTYKFLFNALLYPKG